MKKILMFFEIITLCMMYSCVEPEYKNIDGRNIEIIPNNSMCLRYVEYDGHEYVYYYDNSRGSLCHSPKCGCLNEYKNLK